MKNSVVNGRYFLQRGLICLVLLSVSYCYAWAQAELSVSDQEEILAFIKEHYPEKYQEVIALKEPYPELYLQSLLNAQKAMPSDSRTVTKVPEISKTEKPEEGKSIIEQPYTYSPSTKTTNAFSAGSAKNSRQESDIIAFVQREFPQQYESLRLLQEKNPQRFQEYLAGFQQLLEKNETLKKSNPEFFNRLQDQKKEKQPETAAPLSVAEEKEVLSFLKQDLPDAYAMLMKNKEKDDTLYKAQLAHYKTLWNSNKNLKQAYPDLVDRMKSQEKERASAPALTDSQEKEVLEYLSKAFPQFYESLKALKDKDPKRYQEMLKIYRQVQQNSDMQGKNYVDIINQMQSSQASSNQPGNKK